MENACSLFLLCVPERRSGIAFQCALCWPVLERVPLVPCLGLVWRGDGEMNRWTGDCSIVSILKSTVPFRNPRPLAWAHSRDSLTANAGTANVGIFPPPEGGKQPGHTGEKLGWPDGTMTGPGHRLLIATGCWGNCSAMLLS